MTYIFFTLADKSKEKATTSMNLAALAGDGSNYAALLASEASMLSAIQGITDGAVFEHALVARRVRLTNVWPNTGHREDKWLVRYQDNTSLKVYNCEIPNANEAGMHMATGTDFWDLENLAVAQSDFIDAFETNVKSVAGNAVTVLSVQYVGRNT